MEIIIQTLIAALEPLEKILTFSLIFSIIFGGYILTDQLCIQDKIKNKFNKKIPKFFIVLIYGIVISILYVKSGETTPMKAYVSYVSACTIYSHVVKFLKEQLNKKEKKLNE